MPRPMPITDDALDLVAARFRVLGESSRLRLLRALQAGERSVGELVQETGLTQANGSRHLQALHEAGVVGRRKDGLKVFYHIADPAIFDLCHVVCGGMRRELQERVKVLR